MSIYAKILAAIFGTMMLILSATIAVETIIRKAFSISIGGVDELSGYAIAIGGPIAFAVALIEQAHIRINLLHVRLPLAVRAILNAVAATLLAALSIFLMVFTLRTFDETQTYGSLAQTPWATPLVYPQLLWLVAMALFVIPAVLLALHAIWMLIRRDWRRLDREFSPDTVEDELEAELTNLHEREG